MLNSLQSLQYTQHPPPQQQTVTNRFYKPLYLSKMKEQSIRSKHSTSASVDTGLQLKDANFLTVQDFQTVLRSTTTSMTVNGFNPSDDFKNLPKIKQLQQQKMFKIHKKMINTPSQNRQTALIVCQDDPLQDSVFEESVQRSQFYSQYNYQVLATIPKKNQQQFYRTKNFGRISLDREHQNWNQSVQEDTQNVETRFRRTQFVVAGWRSQNQSIGSPAKEFRPETQQQTLSNDFLPLKLNKFGGITAILKTDLTEKPKQPKPQPKNCYYPTTSGESQYPIGGGESILEQKESLIISGGGDSNILLQEPTAATNHGQNISIIGDSMINASSIYENPYISEEMQLQPRLWKEMKVLLLDSSRKHETLTVEITSEDAEQAMVNRLEKFKKRKLRPLSAKHRTKLLEQKLKEDKIVGAGVKKLEQENLYDQIRDQRNKERFQQSLRLAQLPRLTDLGMKDYVVSFINVMERAQEKHAFDANIGEDQQWVNNAYKMYIIELQKKQQIYQEENARLTTSDSQTSTISITENVERYKMLLKLKVQQEMNNTRLNRLDITEIEHGYIELEKKNKKINQYKGKPGQNWFLKAIQEILKNKEKSWRFCLSTKRKENLKRYKQLLEDDCQSDFELAKSELSNQSFDPETYIHPLPSQAKRKQIERGFVTFAGESENIENHNAFEIVEDSEQKFDDYLQRREIQSKVAGQEIANRNKDQELSSNYHYNSTLFEYVPTTRMAMLKVCNRLGDIALPIISKIQNRELHLFDYNLSHTHFQGLVDAIEIDPTLFKVISLVNCGVDDIGVSILLEGCKKLAEFQSLTITRGEIGVQTVKCLQFLISRGNQGLQSFKLKDVKINKLASEKLFKTFYQRCSLRCLSLVNFEFTERSFHYFVCYFEKSERLQELDISGAIGLRPFWYVNFLQILSFNTTLRSLNLNGSSFIENQVKAVKKLENPYVVFQQLMERWKKMGPGQKFPSHLVVNGRVPTKKVKTEQEGPGGKPRVEMPSFKVFSELDAFFQREDNKEVTKFVDHGNKNIKKMLLDKSLSFQDMIQSSDPGGFVTKQMFEEMRVQAMKDQEEDNLFEKEEVSELGLIATEAIYKFIRRNQVIQHLDVSNCNLTQVMIARICLGVKCSKTIMGAHFTGNPGVTPAVKSYLMFILKAYDQASEKKSEISTHVIEGNQNLKEKINQQLEQQHAAKSLIHDTVTMRNQIKKGNCIKQDVTADISVAISHTLVFTRLIGHKRQIPGSGKWKMLTQPHQECWICAKHTMTYFFWNAESIRSNQLSESFISKQKVVEKLNTASDLYVPTIYGQFTNWEPQPMVSLQAFLNQRKQKPDPNFVKCTVTTCQIKTDYDLFLSDLNKDQTAVYYWYKDKYPEDHLKNWKRHLGSSMYFNQPCLPGFEFYKNCDDFTSQGNYEPLYIFAAMVKPAKHYYIVQEPILQPEQPLSTRTDEDQLFQLNRCDDELSHEVQKVFSLYKTIIPLREESLPQISKDLKTAVVARQFQKHTSVFKPWKPDTPATLKACFEEDWKCMGIQKLLTDEKDTTILLKLLKKNYAYLKDIHTDFLAANNLPYINIMDFVAFSQKCALSDSNYQQAQIDLVFVQVDQYNPETKNNIKRSNFVEALIRIAKQKYIDQGKEKNLSSAVKALLDLIEFKYGTVDKWQGVRKDHFWTLEVNDILHANIDGLQSVYKSFHERKKTWMSKEESIYMMTQQMTNLKVKFQFALKCFSMSKMTVIVEEKMAETTYLKLKFVEFLEMLCRIAFYHFDEFPDLKNLPLAKKLEIVVENVLTLKGLERKEPSIKTVMDSDCNVSDEDY